MQELLLSERAGPLLEIKTSSRSTCSFLRNDNIVGTCLFLRKLTRRGARRVHFCGNCMVMLGRAGFVIARAHFFYCSILSPRRSLEKDYCTGELASQPPPIAYCSVLSPRLGLEKAYCTGELATPPPTIGYCTLGAVQPLGV